MSLMLIQLVIIVILLIFIIFMLRQNVALGKERRIARYAIEPIKNDEISVLENLILKYNNFVKKIRKYMEKISLFSLLSKKYEKYILYGDKTKPIDFITNKLVISIIFIFIAIFSNTLQNKVVDLFGLLIIFFIGYYLLDIYLVINQKRRIKLIENQMLRAIIIMNNAFKSGKSTIQAVEIAANELPQPISDEFHKIYLDMKYGLAIDTVFERFAKRINIESARYLSSSLTILNKTGGIL